MIFRCAIRSATRCSRYFINIHTLWLGSIDVCLLIMALIGIDTTSLALMMIAIWRADSCCTIFQKVRRLLYYALPTCRLNTRFIGTRRILYRAIFRLFVLAFSQPFSPIALYYIFFLVIQLLARLLQSVMIAASERSIFKNTSPPARLKQGGEGCKSYMPMISPFGEFRGAPRVIAYHFVARDAHRL